MNANRKSESISFSSISERLSVIQPAYFEKLYTKCIVTYEKGWDEAKRFWALPAAQAIGSYCTGLTLGAGICFYPWCGMPYPSYCWRY